jgi:hypothetical protein
MWQRRINIPCLTALFLTIFIPASPAIAQSDPGWVYFSETGHTVQEPFLTFFKNTGGLARYGFPITDEYVDPQTKLIVQYFQKARLESHPDNPDPYKVQLGLLGDELGQRRPPIPVESIPSASDPSCVYFNDTGHSVCYYFLDYWRQAGGLDLFGYPISEYLIENGVIVQYFQRAKMEWQPSKPAGQRIQLAPLGEIYYKWAKLDPRGLEPQLPIDSRIHPAVSKSIKARAAVLEGAVPPGGTQAAYVRAVDQLNRPLANAAVTLIIHYPSGDKSFTLSPTDTQGVTMQFFNAGNAAVGTIIAMEFIVSSPGLEPVWAPTSYMIWNY